MSVGGILPTVPPPVPVGVGAVGHLTSVPSDRAQSCAICWADWLSIDSILIFSGE